jgi:hypothetical protein
VTSWAEKYFATKPQVQRWLVHGNGACTLEELAPFKPVNMAALERVMMSVDFAHPAPGRYVETPEQRQARKAVQLRQQDAAPIDWRKYLGAGPRETLRHVIHDEFEVVPLAPSRKLRAAVHDVLHPKPWPPRFVRWSKENA